MVSIQFITLIFLYLSVSYDAMIITPDASLRHRVRLDQNRVNPKLSLPIRSKLRPSQPIIKTSLNSVSGTQSNEETKQDQLAPINKMAISKLSIVKTHFDDVLETINRIKPTQLQVGQQDSYLNVYDAGDHTILIPGHSMDSVSYLSKTRESIEFEFSNWENESRGLFDYLSAPPTKSNGEFNEFTEEFNFVGYQLILSVEKLVEFDCISYYTRGQFNSHKHVVIIGDSSDSLLLALELKRRGIRVLLFISTGHIIRHVELGSYEFMDLTLYTNSAVPIFTPKLIQNHNEINGIVTGRKENFWNIINGKLYKIKNQPELYGLNQEKMIKIIEKSKVETDLTEYLFGTFEFEELEELLEVAFVGLLKLEN